jgi:hypothetical protein
MRHLTSREDPNRYYTASEYDFCRSDNRGVSWRCTSALDDSKLVVNPQNREAVQVDPFDADHLLWRDYDERLHRSTDGGQSATLVDTPFYPWSTAFALDVRGRVFGYDVYTNRVYRSEDSGNSWSEVGELESSTCAQFVSRIVPAPSDSTYLYATDRTGIQYLDPSVGRWQCSEISYATSMELLAVDPSNPLIAYSTFGNSEAEGLSRTEDGGRTWLHMSGEFDNQRIHSLAIHPREPRTILAVVSDWRRYPRPSGVYRSKDGGENWERFDNFSSVADVVNLNIQNPWNTEELFAATEGFGVQASLDGGRTYQFRSDGLTDVNINALAVAPWQPGLMFAGADTGMFRSDDSAQNWSPAGLTGEVRDIAVDSDGSGRRLWAVVAGEGVAFSSDGGTSFTMTSAGLSSLDLTGIEVVQDGTGRRLWAVTRGGAGIHYFDEGAQVWVPAAGNGLTDRNVVDVESDGTGRRLWAVAESGVFVSDDHGVTWHAYSDGLPDGAPLTSIAIDEMTGELFVSAFAGGVFRRALHDAAWTPFNDGLNDLRVNRVTQGEAPAAADLRTLYAATSGSGLFSANVPTLRPSIETNTLEEGVVGEPYLQSLSAVNGAAPLTWKTDNGRLPDGLRLDPGTGIISGAPTSRGDFHFVVTVEDARGLHHSKAFTITVQEPTGPLAAMRGLAPYSRFWSH